MKKKPYYITTPIYYPSEKFHIGHTFTTVLCDTMARYKRMRGFDVMFLTGTDDHGLKIETNAKKAGVSPKEFVDKIVASAQHLWKTMDISYDRFIRTTDDYHVESVQKIFTQLYEQDDIYKSVYKGYYCRPCESFWTESQLLEGKLCPDCHRPVEYAEEEAYFFRLSNYTDRILKLYQDNPKFLQPQSRVNEMVNNFLKPGLEDLCVSRSSFSWGVPVEFDPDHVVYVWIDALSNYITALGYQNEQYDDMDTYWPADLHMMAKEIVRFHSIIWPALLMALDLPLPKQVYAHGWILFDGGKMSKSVGNVVDPFLLIDRYGVDAVRYYLLRDISMEQDSSFSNEGLISRINADLANDLGNLVSRTVAMADQYFGGTLPQERKAGEHDQEIVAMANALPAKIDQHMNDFKFNRALADIFDFVARLNKYIDETEPWVLGREEGNEARLASVLYNLLEGIRILGVLLTPFLPHTSPEIFQQIGAPEELTTGETLAFGKLPATVTVSRGKPLFPRIDMEKELAELEAIAVEQQKKATQAAKAEEEPEQDADTKEQEITFDQFMETKLVAATVTECELIPKADKLLKLTLDDGSGTPRQVVSGIREWYTPEDLLGKKVAIVANLKSVKLRGVESQGMILAVDVGDTARVIFLDNDVPNGAAIH